jgi:hypothetical protein
MSAAMSLFDEKLEEKSNEINQLKDKIIADLAFREKE